MNLYYIIDIICKMSLTSPVKAKLSNLSNKIKLLIILPLIIKQKIYRLNVNCLLKNETCMRRSYI